MKLAILISVEATVSSLGSRKLSICLLFVSIRHRTKDIIGKSISKLSNKAERILKLFQEADKRPSGKENRSNLLSSL